MAGIVNLVAGGAYYMRTFTNADWNPGTYGGMPTKIRLVEPDFVEWDLIVSGTPPTHDSRWPGSGLVSLPVYEEDVSAVFEIVAGGGWTVDSTEEWVSNAGS